MLFVFQKFKSFESNLPYYYPVNRFGQDRNIVKISSSQKQVSTYFEYLSFTSTMDFFRKNPSLIHKHSIRHLKITPFYLSPSFSKTSYYGCSHYLQNECFFCTYGRFNLRGAAGYAPVISLDVDMNGKFVGANIIPIYQQKAHGPKIGPQNRASNKLIALTNEYSPNTTLKIRKDGTLSRK